MKLRLLPALLTCLLATQAGPVVAQIFLRLDNITGSSADTNHAGWMQVQSATVMGATVTYTKAGPNINTNREFADLCLSKPLDADGPILPFRCAQGTNFNSGTLDFTELASTHLRYLRLNLTNIYVTNIRQWCDESGPGESICLSPQICSWNYTHYRANTGLPDAYRFTSWDLANSNGAFGTNISGQVITGVRNANGVQLHWTATAGKPYRIFAVTALNQPFVPVAQFTAAATGETNYTFVPTASAMFYTVEEVPAGY